jgi:predicted Zn-dependent protease with MMP-like domain
MPSLMSGQEAARTAPSALEIERIARATIASLPDAFRRHTGEIVLVIDELADDSTLAALGIDDPFELSGLYHGRPLAEKSAFDSGGMPDRIHLFRRAILDEWIADGEDLATLVRHIVIHEIGHHFGLSDADMHRLEDES